MKRTRARASRVPRHLTHHRRRTACDETCIRGDLDRWPSSSLLAACGGGAGGPAGGGGKISDDKIVLGVLNDQSGVYSRPVRQERGRGRGDGRRRLQGQVRRQGGHQEHRGGHRRPPEQAGRSPTPRRRSCTTGRRPTRSSTCRPRRRRSRSPTWPRQKKKLYFNIGAATTELTGKPVQQVHVPLRLRHLHARQRHRHDGDRSRARRTGTSSTRTTRSGRTWRRASPRPIEAAGGTVVGKDATPFPNRQLLHVPAQGADLSPKPDVLGTMQAGGDLVNLVKQYNEFKLQDKGVGLVGRADVHHRHPLARPGRAWPAPVHRRLVLELRRSRTARGPTSSRRRPAPGRRSRTPATTRPRCSTSRPCRRPAPTTPTTS